MGLYYYFPNKTTDQDNAHPIFGEYKHLDKLNSIDDELFIQPFELVITNNGFNKTDEIVAEVDYPGFMIYVYVNGNLTISEPLEEQFDTKREDGLNFYRYN